MQFAIHSFRKYGQPKLEKPKELKNIKNFSVDYIPKKCKYEIYVLKDKDEIWIKSKDWFSPDWQPPKDDLGKSVDYYANKYFGYGFKSKFIYSDNWSSIVLRQEAWIIFKGVFKDIEGYDNRRMFTRQTPTQIYIKDAMLRCIEKYYNWPEYDLACSDLSRCFESIVKEVYLPNGR